MSCSYRRLPIYKPVPIRPTDESYFKHLIRGAQNSAPPFQNFSHAGRLQRPMIDFRKMCEIKANQQSNERYDSCSISEEFQANCINRMDNAESNPRVVDFTRSPVEFMNITNANRTSMLREYFGSFVSFNNEDMSDMDINEIENDDY